MPTAQKGEARSESEPAAWALARQPHSRWAVSDDPAWRCFVISEIPAQRELQP